MKIFRSAFPASCLLTVLAAFVFSALFVDGAQAETKTFRIGLISSVSGPMAPAFKSEIVAAKPATELLNKQGGLTVNGQKYIIEIVTADDQSSPPGAIAAANKLIQDGIKYIISPMFVPSDMAIAQTCEEAKVLRVCPNRSDPAPFAPPNKYSFNAEATGYYIPYVYDKLATLYPDRKRVAIVWPDDPGATLTTEMTAKEIERRGLQVVFNEAYKIPNEDFYPILTKALATKPDEIQCIFAIPPWAKGIINQARELGFTGPITAVSSLADTNILRAMINPQYAYDICHANPDVTSPKMSPVVKELQALVEAQTKERFNFDHVFTYGAASIMIQGIEKAQSFDTDKVVAALESMPAIETPFGTGRFEGKELIGINRLLRRQVPFSRFVKGGTVEFEYLPLK